MTVSFSVSRETPIVHHLRHFAKYHSSHTGNSLLFEYFQLMKFCAPTKPNPTKPISSLSCLCLYTVNRQLAFHPVQNELHLSVYIQDLDQNQVFWTVKGMYNS